MSTTFKIIENHIQNSKNSPKKSFIMTQSQHLSPSSHQNESEDGSQQMDKEEVLRLQIKQLQRQNKFLKKKINQLTAQLNGQQQQSRKKQVSGKGAIKQDIDPIHLSVDFFFKEINSLMNSMTELFRVQFSNDDINEFASRFPHNEENVAAQRRYVVFKKFVLTRKLQKIALEAQQKRYPMLLQVFSSYYKAKQQCDKYIRQIVDDLSTRVLQLNKMIVNNATKRKSSMKGSSIRSSYTFDEQKVDKLIDTDYQLSIPWSLKRLAPSLLTPSLGNSSFGFMNEGIKNRLNSENDMKD